MSEVYNIGAAILLSMVERGKCYKSADQSANATERATYFPHIMPHIYIVSCNSLLFVLLQLYCSNSWLQQAAAFCSKALNTSRQTQYSRVSPALLDLTYLIGSDQGGTKNGTRYYPQLLLMIKQKKRELNGFEQ